MVFSSTVFLLVFLPAVWLIHTLIPPSRLKARNFVLAAAGPVFYAYGAPVFVFALLISIACNYGGALLLDKLNGKARKALFIALVCGNAGLLCFYKYLPPLFSFAGSVFPADFPLKNLALPIGISFYTFQILSYIIDVYRKDAKPDRDPVNVLLYIAFFPQFIAGPIVKYGDFSGQIAQRSVTLEKTAGGIARFITGLAKKTLIADTAALIADAAFGASSPSSALAWAGAAAYCLQIYFDFSGYSDMAIGLAAMFGFRFSENFNYPYAAFSIRDFWKRWHISLTGWFREYVYIPLGGNRKGKARTIANRIFIFFLTGLWHGADLTFVLWGLWHGLLMLLEEAAPVREKSKNTAVSLLQRGYTLLAVLLGFVLFRADGVSSALAYFGAMFSFSGGAGDLIYLLSPYVCLWLGLGIVLSFPVFPALKAAAEKKPVLEAAGRALSLPLAALCVLTLASSAFHPFIYYIF